MKQFLGVMVVVVAAAMAVGCGTKPNPASCVDNHCSDPERPFCDVDGSFGGEPQKCIAVECTPSAFETCKGDRALTCNASGDNFELVECEFGCDETSGCKPCDSPQCEKHVIPKYVPNVCNELAPPSDLTISSNETFDTTNPLNCSSVVMQISGPPICVVHYRSITVQPNQTFTIVGANAIALVADRALKIQGVLDASAAQTVNGPGGGTRQSGGSGGGNGGGGAGYRTAGGHGANTSGTAAAANGGAALPNPTTLMELFGGPRPADVAGGSPGGGGGGVTLISCRDTISIEGLVDVGGGGGGFYGNFNTPPSTGGGAGGTLVLQGMNVRVTGELYANGGGGGAGGNGTDGLRSTTAAPGGGAGGVAGSGGIGGRGGTMLAPGDGTNGSGSPYGAGGGSAGFLLVYTPQGVVPTLSPSGISPQFELPPGTIPTN